MSVRAGSILTVAGNNVVDRIQSAGLGDVKVPVDTVREVGNDLVVDKVTQEPDFTFSMDSLDTSVELMAFLTGKTGSAATGPGAAPGSTDADGTEYKWEDVTRFLNVLSPWKDPTSGASGTIQSSHLIPGYYPTKLSYKFGVTDNAQQTVELGGGSFYYGAFPTLEEFNTGNGATTAFATAQPAIITRKGGASSSTLRSVFGVIVNGVLQTEGTDYSVSGGAAAPGSVATVTFVTAPANGAKIRFAYFTSTPQFFPQAAHASTVTKPGAVRGRNICVKLGSAHVKLAGVQSFELDATVEGEVEREFCNDEPTGRVVNGLDCTGTLTVRPKDSPAFYAVLKAITGVSTDQEVVGWLNDNPIPLQVEIQNPKNPSQLLKTLYVSDAKLQVPGTPAKVNSATDFAIGWESVLGTFSEFKGAKP